MKQKPLFFLVALLTVVTLTACGGNPFAAAPTPTAIPVVAEQGLLHVEGRVVPKTYSTLAFAVNGEIDKIAVEEGAVVGQGDLLISLGKREAAQAQLSSARLEELSAQQALDTLNRKAAVAVEKARQTLADAQKAAVEARKAVADLDTDDYTNKLDDKKTAVQNAKDKLKDANEEFDKRKDLDADNQVRKDADQKVKDAQKELDAAVRDLDLWENQKTQTDTALAEAEAALVDAQTEVDNRASGADKDELALAQSRLDNAKAAVQAAERYLADMDLTAPFAGTVADLNGLAAGQWVSAGRSAVTLADFSEWYVETKDLNELDVVDVKVGQKVSLMPDALPGTTLAGEVTSIKPVYTERSGDVLYTVRIRLTDSDDRVRWGMTVQVTFE
jgi:multidrug efflux pump subunit AcrA (membrane-fusion protein)